MKKIEITHWNPEFSSEEAEALYNYLDDEGELSEDGMLFVCTKEEFLELDVYKEDHFNMDNEDEVETASYFASMLERIKGLSDDDILKIDLSGVCF